MCFNTEKNFAVPFREFEGRINDSYIQSQENHEKKAMVQEKQ